MQDIDYFGRILVMSVDLGGIVIAHQILRSGSTRTVVLLDDLLDVELLNRWIALLITSFVSQGVHNSNLYK